VASTTTRRRLARAGLLAGAALGLTLSAGATASAAPAAPMAAPAISVTPQTNLSDGQTVTVAGQGLTPGTTYHVGECAPIDDQAYACAPTNVSVVASADGTLQTPLTVLKSFGGHDASGALHPVDCAETECVIGVYDINFSGGSVPISFS
jgi:hypothetical protein